MENLLRLGFTGTQMGMTAYQKAALAHNLRRWLQKYEFLEIHHGDCIGADADFHELATSLWEDARPATVSVVLHPPENTSKRAYCTWIRQVERDPLPYLERNRAIVDESAGMLVSPKGMEEELRSGTWATYRYAKKVDRPLIILWPVKS